MSIFFSFPILLFVFFFLPRFIVRERPHTHQPPRYGHSYLILQQGQDNNNHVGRYMYDTYRNETHISRFLRLLYLGTYCRLFVRLDFFGNAGTLEGRSSSSASLHLVMGFSRGSREKQDWGIEHVSEILNGPC